MRGRSAGTLTLIVASTLAWAWPARCGAQSPSALEAPPALGRLPAAPPAAGQPAAELPSTVSPAIQRFLKNSGRDKLPPRSTVPTRSEPGAMAPPGEPRPLIPLPATIPAIARRVPSQSLAGGRPGGAQEGRRVPRSAQPGTSATRSPDIEGPRTPRRLSPLAVYPNVRPAPLEPNDLRFPINLATALRLADARPLIVAAAQASVWVAEADLTQARLLFVPMLNVAADYLRHDGGGPDFNKGIMTAPSVNFFYAGVGLWGFISSTDALFQPLVARQTLNARHWDVQASKNDAVLQTAEAYFRVHQYRGMYAGTLYCVEQGHVLIEKLAAMSRDLIPEFEVERARNFVADLEQRAVLARQQWRVNSANLTQLLRLDPRAVVTPLEPDHLQITLIEPGRPLDDLMPIAMTNRPEIASRRATVEAATAAVRREKMRPMLPGIALNGYQSPGGMLIQAGIFGLGPNSSLSQWTGREDVSIQLVWQLENLGFGNLAMIKRQRGEQSRATVVLFRAQDMVAADVMRAHARLQSAAVRVIQADRAMRTGIINLNGNYEGLGETSRFANVLHTISRPQEAVYSLQLLNRSFDEYFTTVAEYNIAQFDLYHAMGYPAQEIAVRMPVGEVAPIELRRPKFLPSVGHGPPPATR
ncbi:MAG: TolC family protein [Isosphaeraceae bacterium]